AAVERLGGRLEIDSKLGRGTRLTLTLPLRRALVPALLVRCGGELFALPLAAVERAAPPGAGARSLSECLGLPAAAPNPAAALVLQHVDRPVTLLVDEIVGPRDLVFQPLPAPLAPLRRFAGAALLEDGSMALLLDGAAIAAAAASR
ncbi:MAG TPA: chemotaxis protein CheW, partial [Candidatus Polarisedimenticolaceae bacterium]|nr:chemotaxis protein CheW [Candidatus Polarisedimenticolaceae bacterium]